jgi:predicted dehydrogenase
MKTYKAVIIGAAHMHALYLARECLANPRIELCGYADTPALREELAGSPPFTRKWNIDYIARLGVPFFEDFRKMLDAVHPDLALVSTETPLHTMAFEACAERGVAVSLEKPMAVSYSDGLKMARTAERTGTMLLVNWPLAWQPFMGQYKELIEGGTIGRLAKVHHLVGHPGPLGKGVRHPLVMETSDATTGAEKAATWWHTAASGGGAMLDFCGYGAMACNYLVRQQAAAVTAMRCNTQSGWGDADDNAAMLVRYPGCLAVLEGSWTVPNGGISPAPTLFGSEAMVSALVVPGGVQVNVLDYFGHSRSLPVLGPVPHLLNITTAFVHHRDTNEPLPSFLDLYENLEVLAILDAGVRSASSGKAEMVATRAWEIG